MIQERIQPPYFPVGKVIIPSATEGTLGNGIKVFTLECKKQATRHNFPRIGNNQGVLLINVVEFINGVNHSLKVIIMNEGTKISRKGIKKTRCIS